ncbi:MAG TPA: response regulator [Kofleriaceae bacterium]|jgi:CheY-like chemotaxis protein|nr:response regulator [Kofleriaceae bacterium]
MKRILIVDDNPVVIGAAKRVLSHAGYDVETRGSVAEVDARGADGFDLILMDVVMPELFGDDVAAILRHERGVRGRIVLYSTLDEPELKQRTLDAKVDGYINKALGLKHLVAEVERILAEPEPT